MKNYAKLWGMIAVAAIIGFSMAACDDLLGNNKESALTGTVTISGTPAVGQTLTAVTTALGGNGTITFSWKSGGTSVGQNTDKYMVTTSDVGKTITVTVTRAGYTGSVTSAPTAAVTSGGTGPALTGTVTINGTPAAGQTLTANISALTGDRTASYSYEWKRHDVSTDAGWTITYAENKSTFTPITTDVGKYISVTVTNDKNSGSVKSNVVGPVTGSQSVPPTPLIEDEWVDGELAMGDSEDWYSLSVTSGTTYYVWWNSEGISSNGDSTKTGYVSVAAFDNDGFMITGFGKNDKTEVTGRWLTPQPFTPTFTGTAKLRVTPYHGDSGNEGTYAIVYSTTDTRPSATPEVSLTDSVWADGDLITGDQVDWYTFDVTAGTTYYIWWNRYVSALNGDVGDNTKDATILVGAWFNDTKGTALFGGGDTLINGWQTPQMYTATADGTVYLRVKPYISSQRGTYGIMYSTRRTGAADPVELDAYDWVEGDFTGERYRQDWYTFEVTAGSKYYLWWNISTREDYIPQAGDGTYTGWVAVSAWLENTLLFGGTNTVDENYAWEAPKEITAASDGTVYVRVITNNFSDTTGIIGDYAIMYNTTGMKNPIVALTENEWADGEITKWTQVGVSGVSEEDWYSFNVTEGETYSVYLNKIAGMSSDMGDGTKTGSAAFSAWYNIEDQEYIFQASAAWQNAEYSTFTATSTGTVYVKVYIIYGGIGTYAVVYTTGDTRPE